MRCHFTELLAFETHRERRGPNQGQPGGAQRRAFWILHHRGEPGRQRRLDVERGGERGAEVDERRQHPTTAGIDDAFAPRRQARAELEHRALADAEVSHLIDPLQRVDEPAVANEERAAHDTASSTAFRTATPDLDRALAGADAVMMLRVQRERQGEALFPSASEYHRRWGLTAERASRLSAEAVVLHPGPVNRGLELAPEVADG
ncbi:MAG: hypothetical protein JNG84_13380, partial [Archangium sp.]|nr:hypothetical protein [Archangium sp.]